MSRPTFNRPSLNPVSGRARPLAAEPDRNDVARVAAWRRMRMSWTAIARNLGVSEDAARRRFDPDYRAPQANPVRRTTPPALNPQGD